MSSKAVSKRHISKVTASDGAELSRHLLKAEEEERRRISRELHDETGQALMVLRFHLEMLAAGTKNEEQRTKVRESLDVLDRTIEGLRRIIGRLSPRVLEELGLITAIRRQAQLLARHTRIKAHLEMPEELAPMNHDIEVALYRSVQEALHNIAKHSQARNFTVRLQTTGERVSLEIQDDGVGLQTRSPHETGFGLTGMRERMVALGGSMRIHSQRAKGTQIRIVLPWIADATSKGYAGDATRLRRLASTRAS